MKKVNRFKVLFTLFAMLLAYCVFVSTNVLFNVFAVLFGTFGLIFGFVYIACDMTKKERTFFNKWFYVY